MSDGVSLNDLDIGELSPVRQPIQEVPSNGLNTPKGVVSFEDLRDAFKSIDNNLNDLILYASKITSLKENIKFHDDFDVEMDKIRTKFGERSEAESAKQRYRALSNRLLEAVGVADTQKYKVQAIKTQLDMLKKVVVR